ncbi:MAG: UvrD-helicase domain-containing protein [Candidatus Yanofskybacteria bacterium]|nr:UvrD-helicase domain-containing protein [Candidatus Yanofskybacteria bacterium]
MDNIFQGLNDKQIEAVRAIEGPVLVISGPGSGKTRCLTHRVAYLISQGIRPCEILGITFTNKAANEIKERVYNLLKIENRNLKIASATPMLGTFHSICLRILRREIPVLGYGSNFTIFDSDDQTGVVKRVMGDLEIDPKKFNPRAILAKISRLKTNLIFPEKFEPDDFFSKVVARVYGKYQTELKKMNGLDFDDLIVLTVKIFKQNPDILEKYQNVWKYILVDEYQDTSHDQYQLVTLLAQKHKNLFVIGDDAQSIYMFRDADIKNILNFQKDYPDAKVIFLEQNYRSTKNILAAAQNVISNNQSQVPKELWTENDHGEKILIREALNERDEAGFIIETMEDLTTQGYKINDFAILYRTHAQSRAIEEALITRGFPYQIVGGIKFYERREIKDMLAYLKVVSNPSDVVSFERIYNLPPRGIGSSTFQKIVKTEETNLISAVAALAAEMKGSRQGPGLEELAKLLKDLNSKKSVKLTELIKYIVRKTNYEDYLLNTFKKSGVADTVQDRIENIKELLTVAKKHDSLKNGDGIAIFLEEIALLQDADPTPISSADRHSEKGRGWYGAGNLKNINNRVVLMTAHSSKGLEFPIVFIAGMEEGLFPHSRSLIDPKELEEERRLCYVAITRAKKKLHISYAKYRHIFGSTEANLPSRFIGEMPGNVLDVRTSMSNFYTDDDEKIIKY